MSGVQWVVNYQFQSEVWRERQHRKNLYYNTCAGEMARLDSSSADVYAGLRQFHRAKGFDPDSQDVACHLGYPIYQLHRAGPVDPLFAHGKSSPNDS
jgi:hypothetical protein